MHRSVGAAMRLSVEKMSGELGYFAVSIAELFIFSEG